MRFLLLSLMFLTACGSAPRITEEPSSDRGRTYRLTSAQERSLRSTLNPGLLAALQIKAETDRANLQDLHGLLAFLRRHPMEDGDGEFSTGLAGLLRRDLAIVREVHSAIYGWPEYIGTPALRTSLGKLISSGRDDSGRSLTGLYEDAAEFYEQYGLFLRRGHRPPVELRHNTITVVKLLLFYMHKLRDRMATGNEEGPAPVHLQLLYPERFPDEIDPDLYRDLTLYSAGTGRVYFPNAGYIYGGNFVGNENKGIDCSAYLSKATGSSVRMSTWYMSVAWLVDRGRSEEVDPAILDEFTGLGLEQTLEEFMAVDPVSDDLKPGDLVVWREDSGGGHVTMYTGLGRGNRIIGIEATRADDKSKEGLLFVSHELQADDAATYVLRRRQDAAHRVMPKPVIY